MGWKGWGADGAVGALSAAHVRKNQSFEWLYFKCCSEKNLLVLYFFLSRNYRGVDISNSLQQANSLLQRHYTSLLQ